MQFGSTVAYRRVRAPVSFRLRRERRKVKAVHVVPKRNPVVVSILVFQKRDAHVGDVRKD
jgi:hypothetical protein